MDFQKCSFFCCLEGGGEGWSLEINCFEIFIFLILEGIEGFYADISFIGIKIAEDKLERRLGHGREIDILVVL
ncbi:MAG: hypothetical protein D6805_05565 [Planctomycetota bacterium]|nr:MAG: hypothetical protein D6805_05565 [Planctomycetota bacterium]